MKTKTSYTKAELKAMKNDKRSFAEIAAEIQARADQYRRYLALPRECQ